MKKDQNELENEVELEEEEYEEYEEEERGPSGLSLALNKYFHHLDRGGSLGGELVHGLTMAMLAACVIFLNMQLIGNLIAGAYVPGNSPLDPNNIAFSMTYADLYAAGVLICVLGSIVIGIVANLPLMQISTMGIYASVICLIGAGKGLSYENLLFINLISGIIYAVVAAVPALRSGLKKAIPDPVKKALPAALGIILFYVALQLSGFLKVNTLYFGVSGGNVLVLPAGLSLAERSLQLCGLIGSLAAVVLYVLLKVLKRKRASLFSLLGGTVVFVLTAVILSGGVDTANSESFANFGRIWLIAGSQASGSTPFADSYLTYCFKAIGDVFANLGGVLSKGADFSAYDGSSIAIIAAATLTYLLTGIFNAEGTVLAVDEEAETSKTLLVNGVTNVLAPFFGLGGVSVAKTSVAGAKDGAKSGLASVFAGMFSLISLFVILFPALFATETYPVGSMNQWNYFAYGNGGFIYLVQGVVFSVVDTVMACVGVSMILSIRKLKGTELIPAIVMLVVGLLTTNIVAAVAVGILCAMLLDRKSFSVPALLLSVLGLLAVVLG